MVLTRGSGCMHARLSNEASCLSNQEAAAPLEIPNLFS